MLLDAGLEVIGLAGPSQLTMIAVCERSGLTQRYFYEHFRSRDDFLGVLFSATFDQMFSDVRIRVAQAPAELVDVARAAVTAMVDFYGGDPRVARLWIEANGDPAIGDRKAESVRKITEFAVERAEMIRGPFTSVQQTKVALAASIVIGGQAETTTQWLAGDLDLPRDEYIDQLANLFAVAVDDALRVGPDGSRRSIADR